MGIYRCTPLYVKSNVTFADWFIWMSLVIPRGKFEKSEKGKSYRCIRNVLNKQNGIQPLFILVTPPVLFLSLHVKMSISCLISSVGGLDQLGASALKDWLIIKTVVNYFFAVWQID